MLNNRIMRAIEFCQGLSFSQIGQCLWIGSERARKIVRKYERHLEAINDPLVLIIKELRSLGDATRILKALRGRIFTTAILRSWPSAAQRNYRKPADLASKASVSLPMRWKAWGLLGMLRDGWNDRSMIAFLNRGPVLPPINMN